MMAGVSHSSATSDPSAFIRTYMAPPPAAPQQNPQERAVAIDAEFAEVDRRASFELPNDVLYLDGNSLGAMPRSARESAETAIREEWGNGLIRSWNSADWINLPKRVGDRVGALIGAPPGSVLAADSTSLNLYKALRSAMQLNGSRNVIVTDSDNFPTDLYVVDAVAQQRGAEVRAVTRGAIWSMLDEGVSVLTLTHVDYRTSEMADMRALTQAAHDVGALVCWDLAHSAGAVPLDLVGADIDFAVGCGYKFLNGGPGAPAFVYVAPRLLEAVKQPLHGWMGHESPFAFSRHFVPAPGVERFAVGTPPVLGLRSLLGALEVFDGVDLARLHAKSIAMAGLFHDLADAVLAERGFTVYSHRTPNARGSHVALSHEHGYAIVQALIARSIIGDFRRPNVLRFGFAPLYNSAADVLTLVEALVDVVDSHEFHKFNSEATVI
jgi:kynureninase